MSHNLHLLPPQLLGAGYALGLAIIASSSIPAISALISQIRSHTPKNRFYQDEDGKSSPEAVARFSNKWPKTLVVAFAALGFASSLVVSVLTAVHVLADVGLWLEDSLIFASWTLLLLQAICISAIHDAVKAYEIGLWAWTSSLILGLALLALDTQILGFFFEHHVPSFAVRIVNLAAVAGLISASIALPRRPDVFDDQGRPIDAMRNVSAYSRYTFSWCHRLIEVARAKQDLDLADLPRPDHITRSKDTSTRWKEQSSPASAPLWRRLAWFYRWSILLQWSLSIVGHAINFVPHWVSLQILRALERREPGESLGLGTWLMVIWLGFGILADTWLNAIMFWYSWSEVEVPLRGLVSALVIEKALRRKNVKMGSKSDDEEKGQEASENDDDDTGTDNGDEEDGDEEEGMPNSQQGIVNLIGVDAKRVADFCGFHFLLPGSLTSLVMALWFLVSLLGWIPVCAGLATWGLILPVNIYYTKRYAKAQDRLMKLRDRKLAVVSEGLHGIRQIKFSALESQWEKKILAMRAKELGAMWDVFKGDTALFGSWVASPIAFASSSLSVYAWLNGGLQPSIAFVSIGIFSSLEMALSFVPELTTEVIDAKVSIFRIDEYLRAPELVNQITEGPEIAFQDADIAWPVDYETGESERFVLRSVNLSFPSRELSVISGKTGTGKSLVLSAILGEADLLSGKVFAPKRLSPEECHDHKANQSNWNLPANVAYVAQTPWIENATLRDNILFGLPLDEARYNETIRACALQKDLATLSDGHETELGTNGVNLSGGQKWRVTLARAIYSRAGILVLDDIFSAIDAHVGRHIFENCLTGPLCHGRTRILVTHHVALCESKATYVVELGDGTVQHCGLLSELKEEGTLQLIKSHDENSGMSEADETRVNSVETSDTESEMAAAVGGSTVDQVPSTPARKFVEDEERQKGAIKSRVYGAYLNATGGWPWWTLAVFLFCGFELLHLSESWWLRIWTGDTGSQDNDAPASTFSTDHAYALQHASLRAPSVRNDTVLATQSRSLSFYLIIYIAISVVTVIVGTLKFLYIYFMSMKASRRMFSNMTYTVLRTPLRWLDTVPTGRILNRFTADFEMIDSEIATDLVMTINSVLSVLGICAAAALVSPYIIVIAVVLVATCTRIAHVYIEAARSNKRIESNTKSPIFDQFGSALSGLMTIRGSGKTQTYIETMYARLDDYGMATWYNLLFNQWMGWRMGFVGALFAVAVAITVLASSHMDAALAGFTLSFALQFSEVIIWAIRHFVDVELNMNAAERIVEYSELPIEDQGGLQAPATWPSEGRLEVADLVVGYADDLPPVLNGLSFSVEKNERIGVVGRTGAGKSSLTLALFRFLEARSGSIHIDGVDISKLKLHDLRSRLAIIPQDPVLFGGSVRANLDPFEDCSDADLCDALQRVHLIDPTQSSVPGTPAEPASGAPTPSNASAIGTLTPKNMNPFHSLSSHISEGGHNLSQGQRQLLCLARAIVARPKIMLLDEATSAVDMDTDALIQKSIREEFTNSTLLVIAHRLSTIADFDRILVLGDGQVVEYGTPRELWEKADEGVFRAMCENSGERENLKNVIFGNGNRK